MRGCGLPAANATLMRGGAPLARLRVCRTPWEQLRGLIGCAPLPPDFGIALPHCAAVHTAFVRAPIDVFFLRDGRIAGIADGVGPWRIARCPGATFAIELAAGSARRWGISVGDALEVRLDETVV